MLPTTLTDTVSPFQSLLAIQNSDPDILDV